jgi:TonB family protein
MELHSLAFKTLAEASVRSVVLALAAMAGMWLARARSAPVRHAVWTAVVCGMLALPVLSVALPSIPLHILPAAPEIALAPAPIEVSGPAEIRTAPAPPRPQREWTSLALPVWLLVATALLFRLVLGYAVSRKLVSGSAPIRDPRVSEALERLGAMPALGESGSISVPLTAGWSILLPLGWRDWDGAKMDAVLAHEIAHVRRSDWLIRLLAGVNRSLFWFHPLAWWMERRLTTLAEEACDEWSLQATGNRKRYAEVLLEMAEAVRMANGRLTAYAVAMARHSQVRRRIETVLDERRQISQEMTKARWATVLLCAVPLVYGAAALQVQQAPTRPATVKAQNPSGPWPEGGHLEAAAQGQKLTAAEAQSLEEHLAVNPEDLPARGRLIAYYYENGVREPRLKHVFWLIERHPESEIAGFSSAGLSARGGALNDTSDYARAGEMWLEQTRSRANDPRVLGNAAIFFSQAGGAATAEDLLKRLRRLEPNNREWIDRLSSLYLSAIRGASDPQLAASADPGLAERFKSELETSTDGMVVASVGSSLVFLSPGQSSGPIAEFGRRLMKRAEELGVGTVGSVPGGGAPSSKPKLIVRVPPVYPSLAGQAHVAGVVRVEAIVGADGKVKKAMAISGPPLLRQAAVEAVMRWVYRPTLLNGQPAEATTQVDVDFTLPGSLGLKVERSQGMLVLQWNREAEVVRDAQRATLTIVDGDHTEVVTLDLGTLRGGSAVYAPMTGDVFFRLDVLSREGKSVNESVRALPGRP